jgi:hypothetical protein
MLYMFKTFVFLLSGLASYNANGAASNVYKRDRGGIVTAPTPWIYSEASKN